MSQRQIAQKQIETLILKFRQNEDSYKKGSYNETQLRREFLDPFFEALGWDVANKEGLAEQYKDVIHEAAVKVGEQTKAPDYSFRVGGQRKFFVEAKKPSVSIKDDIGPAYQVRRYSWSAKLPLAILSDFEELTVYDCRQKPRPNDKVSVGRVAFYTYDQYLEKFDEIYDLFSKEAVLKGTFDKYAQADAKKKGTTEVDKEFLKDIEHWREILAKSIALHNDKLSNDDLNYSVQTIIDRIIFLRICEDRNLEEYGRLALTANLSPALPSTFAQATADRSRGGSKGGVYKRLVNVFKQADDRYNAGLFDFNKDQITTKLKIDDKVLSEIIGQMYYPASPYVFSQMPIEILGQVYEQFLGKVIRLTAGHHAKVEEKPEVRKAGGVYYTPQYIVDYIVKNTVGALLDPKSDPSPTSPRSGERLASPSRAGKACTEEDRPLKQTKVGPGVGSLTPKEIESIKILDPACGSGSFLIGAYKYLLEYHLNWYTANDPKKYPKAVFTDGRGAWRLTTQEAKKILLNNIFGVDIDSQAVEVTKLSLLLKVLENESREGMEQQLKMFKERALPNIDGNIKCGNSLIGPDFYQGQMDLSPTLPSFSRRSQRGATIKAYFGEGGRGGSKGEVSNEDGAKINPFDWEREFPEIMKNGGFDAVIGNPPYVRIQNLNEYAPEQVKCFNAKYNNIVSENYDIYVLFIYKGHTLLKTNGRLGYIAPHKFFQSQMGRKLREYLYNKKAINEIVDFTTNQIFENATTYTCLMFLNKGGQDVFRYKKYKLNENIDYLRNIEYEKYNVNILNNDFWTFSNKEGQTILHKIKNIGNSFTDITEKIFKGLSTGNDNLYLIEPTKTTKTTITFFSCVKNENVEIEKEIVVPFLYGEDIRRYQIDFKGRYLFYPYSLENGKIQLIPHEVLKSKYPLAYDYICSIKEPLMRRKISTTNADYYKYSAARSLKEYKRSKILIPDMLVANRIAYDQNGEYYHGPAMHSVVFNDKIKGQNHLLYLGILNSKLFWFYISNTSTALRGNAYRLTPEFINTFCFPAIDLNKPKDKDRHYKIVSLVEQMLNNNKQLPLAKNPNEKETLSRQIAATDKQIDKLVYELYGLTEEEIKVVEGEIL